MKILSEAKWAQIILGAGLNSAKLDLISESKLDPYRRVYTDHKNCYKLVLEGEITSNIRVNTLAQEYEILNKCKDIKAIPDPIDYVRTGAAELLTTKYFSAEPLDKVENMKLGSWNILGNLIKINLLLAWKGVSHNDLMETNILVGTSGEVFLVDFDQATATSRYKAFLRTFLGKNLGGPPVYRSMRDIIVEVMEERFPESMKFLVKIKRAVFGRKRVKPGAHVLPQLNDDASDSAKILLAAWKIAQKSDASAPESLYAYYAVNFEGYSYPGERSWVDRWNVLKNVADYSGKRILELGCNMGLLSSYLVKYEGVKNSLAVDADQNIIETAELVNRALQVEVDHLVINFDSEEGWEDRLIGYNPDIVFALNVLNWVNDKERFLRFLGNFDTLVFEGHETFEVEKQRLRSVGFNTIIRKDVTERDRDVLLCRK